MPRLTFNDYLHQRAFLKLAWEEFDQLYSLLPIDQQHALHRYYQPLSDHTVDELKRHRAHITKLEPSLPARAGKCYAKLHRVYETGIDEARAQTSPVRTKRPRQNRAALATRRISVRAVARPEPDLTKLALALIEAARQVGNS